MDHHLYLLVAFASHVAVGYAVVRVLTGLPPAVGAAGALAPDLDLYIGPLLGLPVVHRGVLHTPAGMVVLSCAALLVALPASEVPRRPAAAFGIGYLTHLVVDSFTSAGIMWLYPASAVRVSLGVPIHGAAGTAALWLASLAIVVLGPELVARVRGDDPRTTRRRE